MLIGYNLYLIQTLRDEQTNEEWEDEPYFLRLSYSSQLEAEKARDILAPVYAPSRIEIDCQTSGIPIHDGE